MSPKGYMGKTQKTVGAAQAQIVGQASRLPSKPTTPQAFGFQPTPRKAGRLRYIL